MSSIVRIGYHQSGLPVNSLSFLQLPIKSRRLSRQPHHSHVFGKT